VEGEEGEEGEEEKVELLGETGGGVERTGSKLVRPKSFCNIVGSSFSFTLSFSFSFSFWGVTKFDFKFCAEFPLVGVEFVDGEPPLTFTGVSFLFDEDGEGEAEEEEETAPPLERIPGALLS